MEYYKNLDLADIVYFCEIEQCEKTEVWKESIDKNYVSNLGRVKSFKAYPEGYIKKQQINKAGYLVATVKNIPRTIHQLVSISFLGHVPCGYEKIINHKNLNKLDNREINLEITTPRENTNMKHIKSSSKYVGVFYDNHAKKWRSAILINRKRYFLGNFTNEIDAHNAYQKKLKEHESIK